MPDILQNAFEKNQNASMKNGKKLTTAHENDVLENSDSHKTQTERRHQPNTTQTQATRTN